MASVQVREDDQDDADVSSYTMMLFAEMGRGKWWLWDIIVDKEHTRH